MVTPLELLADKPNWELLCRLQTEQSAAAAPSLSEVNRRLRTKGINAELAAVLVTQLDLRAAARSKFGDFADRMTFTRPGLEQATRLAVAKLHADRFRSARLQLVADLGCGIGSESLALALAGISTFSVDLDAEAVFCTQQNLSPFPGAQVHRGDLTHLTAEDLRRRGVDSIFLDPARRGVHGRQFNPHRWSPPWETIVDMMGWGFPLGVKVAPGIDHGFLPPTYHAQWVSVAGNLVEASLWSPDLAPEGPGRSAALLTDGDPATRVTNPAASLHVLTDPEVKTANAAVRLAPVGSLENYLFEVDPSVIRSGTLAALAETTGTHLFDPSIAYLTGPNLISSPFLTPYKILTAVSLRTKTIRQELRRLDAGWVEVKKRGADIDPAAWQKQLQSDGPTPLVVFATRVAGKHRAIIATREISSTGEQP